MLESREHGSLARALASAREGRRSLVQLAHGKELLSLAVLPLCQPSPWPDAVLMVFGLRNAWRSLTVQFYAQACKLTLVEARVLRALSDGLSPAQIACKHGVAMTTIRSQLLNVRIKTGSRSLMELVRSLDCLPPIMPAVVSVI